MGAPSLDLSPRNFHRPGFGGTGRDGELFWTIKHGSFGTGMVAYGDFLRRRGCPVLTVKSQKDASAHAAK